ncbi:hypothetical protein TWF694_008175 [Orbilia ellipsospora]|uniref:Uncharacterized protein n=1 Tax=Orbilia ellipsospora TaxID=2528407 RepID=A0AAV9XF93_9PEZI
MKLARGIICVLALTTGGEALNVLVDLAVGIPPGDFQAGITTTTTTTTTPTTTSSATKSTTTPKCIKVSPD